METGKQKKSNRVMKFFQMPLHYPRYTIDDYKRMSETTLDRLFAEYGLSVKGDLAFKREFAIGTFLWPIFSDTKKSN